MSVASASRAINGLGNVTEVTRARIVEAAAQLRYVPNNAARSLATRRTDTIGVLLPDLYGDFFSELIRGIDAGARSRGLHLLLSNSHGDSSEAAAAIQSMKGRVDGLIVMSPHVSADVLADEMLGGTPLVLINTLMKGKAPPTLLVDNHAGAFAAVRHLAEGGGRVAHISGPLTNLESRERLRGYHDALQSGEAMVLDGDFSEESGRCAGALLAGHAKRPNAVFAANDMMAIGCMVALAEAGVRVPEDIAVAGFDDLPLARLIHPSLTTVGVNIAEMGEHALERLVATIAGEINSVSDPEIFKPRLVVRQSSTTKNNTARIDAEARGRNKT